MSLTRPSPRGVTIIESMAALLIFSICIIGVMHMNVLASGQNNVARSRTIASKIVRDVADAFERLPFDHPVLSRPTTMAITSADFDRMDVPDGLVMLQDVATMTGVERPMLGAADAIFNIEGDTRFYQVGWRVWRIAGPARNGEVDQLRILIMVRYPTMGGNWRQVTAWAIKTDSRIVTGDPQSAEF